MKIEFDSESITLEELDALITLLGSLRNARGVVTGQPDESGFKELSDQGVLDIAYKMHSCAMSRVEGTTFKTMELYRVAMQRSWNDISPNSRKAVGRQFKKIVDEHYRQAVDGEPVVRFKERNIQNTAIYEVKAKDSADDEL
ncbi:hypothetical protein [Pseudoduganella sp. OTU4001]|uniref:hypothetical protein n=1 Tax=Pseudoduganella sp. OTU4001 TaxID=3043854 RepID=UPI00313D9613